MMVPKLTIPQRLSSLGVTIIFCIPLYFFTPAVIIKNGAELVREPLWK